MLAATVETSRSSDSLNAWGRGWPMMIAPIASAPDGIGTPSHDSVCVTPGASDSVVVAACSAVVPRRSGGRAG